MVDLYEVLGLPRTATRAEIKRAYFRGVRRCPPETRPDEFRRLREAYEILHNPDTRGEYDARTDLGPAVQRQLEQAMGAVERGEHGPARALLTAVLLLHPGLHLARDLLGLSCLADGQPGEALRHFEQLLAEGGRNATYLWHLGSAHAALGQHVQALSVYGEALDLDPRDPRVLGAMVDSLVALGRYDDALLTLDHAVYADGEVDLFDVAFLLRKVELHHLRGDDEAAARELTEVVAVLPRDPQTREVLVRRLYELAGRMFAGRRFPAGVALLSAARQLEGRRDATPLLSAPLLARMSELPLALRGALRDLPGRLPAGAVSHLPYRAAPLLWLLFGALALLGGRLAVGLAEQPWDEGALVLLIPLLLCGPAAIVHGLGLLVRAVRAPAGRYTAIVAPYVVQVDRDRVGIWPLPLLVGANWRGGRGSWIDAFFAKERLTVRLPERAGGARFLQLLHEEQVRGMAALTEGKLDETPGVQALGLREPEQALLRPRRAPWWRLAPALALLWGLGGAALGVRTAVALGTAREQARAEAQRLAEERGWAAARTPQELAEHLSRYPSVRPREEVLSRLAAIYTEARGRYLSRCGPAPGAGVMLDILRALSRRDRQEVPAVLVRFRRNVARWQKAVRASTGAVPGAPPEEATRIDVPRPAGAFDREPALARQRDLTSHLSMALRRVVSPELLLVIAEQEIGADPQAPTIVIEYVVQPVLAGPLPRAFTIDFHVTLEIPGQPPGVTDRDAFEAHLSSEGFDPLLANDVRERRASALADEVFGDFSERLLRYLLGAAAS